jgi:hypothetical protein
MPVYAACNHNKKRVTVLVVATNLEEARKALKTEGRTDSREMRELPERPGGWSLNTATQHFFPEYD